MEPHNLKSKDITGHFQVYDYRLWVYEAGQTKEKPYIQWIFSKYVKSPSYIEMSKMEHHNLWNEHQNGNFQV